MQWAKVMATAVITLPRMLGKKHFEKVVVADYRRALLMLRAANG